MGPLLGVARAYKLMKQAPKARNQLKHAVKSFKWSFEAADEFEGTAHIPLHEHESYKRHKLSNAIRLPSRWIQFRQIFFPG